MVPDDRIDWWLPREKFVVKFERRTDMRLSEAIALGRILMGHTFPNSFCGCALAMGLRGIGKEPAFVGAADFTDFWANGPAQEASGTWSKAQEKEWPWILDYYPMPALLCVEYNSENKIPARDIISDLFFRVADGGLTLDQLIDWVRSVEPAETPAPETEQAVATQAVHAEVVAKNL